jgi:hypothetical protein
MDLRGSVCACQPDKRELFVDHHGELLGQVEHSGFIIAGLISLSGQLFWIFVNQVIFTTCKGTPNS